VPAGLDVHLVCDNNATRDTPEIRTWPTDGILISLADYLAKLGPGSPAEQAGLTNET
jgi:hypothetical protein